MTKSDEIVEILKLRLSMGESIGISTEGMSMMPYLKDANTIFIKSPEQIRLGDIVVYVRGKILIAHRVFKIENEKYFVMGDNAPYYFERIEDKEIVGLVVKIENNQLSFDSRVLYKLWIINVMKFYSNINDIGFIRKREIITLLRVFLYPVQLTIFFLTKR